MELCHCGDDVHARDDESLIVIDIPITKAGLLLQRYAIMIQIYGVMT